MGCLVRLACAFLGCAAGAPWGAYLAAEHVSLASFPAAPAVGGALFAILGGSLGWVVGGAAWRTARVVIVVLALVVAATFLWSDAVDVLQEHFGIIRVE